MYRQASYSTKLIFEYAGEKKEGGEAERLLKERLPPGLFREMLEIPDVPENIVMRHYTNLSQLNYGVDNGLYPLGSCTMKYNPKYTEKAAGLREFSLIHPYMPDEAVQGALRVMYELQTYLAALSGMDAVTLQPAAGAHGEYTGMSIVREYHRYNGHPERNEVIVPDSAHGTNPASAAMAGFKVIEVPSNERGQVNIEALKAAVSDKTAAMMLTNPNTLGIFEERILELAEIIHGAGGLMYYDGANFNAILGRAAPGLMNFDIVHFNLHKTFATPHGGGGPGSGPIGVKEKLEKFLPVPAIEFDGGMYKRNYDRPHSIGKVHGYMGNFAVILKAYLYIRRLGISGLREASERAVVNANYLMRRVEKIEGLELPYKGPRMHEFVVGAEPAKKEKGIRTLDIAKRLLDHGIHAPTIYFPHLVEEALMFEPTESETKETLDYLISVMEEIMSEDPETVKKAPHNTFIGRVDEARAAKHLLLSWRDIETESEA